MCRTILLTLAALVLVTAAAFAAPAPAAPQSGCAPSLDLPALGAQAVCKAAPATAPAQPAFMAAKAFRGHCRCSCSFTPDCNTSADCGGSACLAGVTCC